MSFSKRHFAPNNYLPLVYPKLPALSTHFVTLFVKKDIFFYHAAFHESVKNHRQLYFRRLWFLEIIHFKLYEPGSYRSFLLAVPYLPGKAASEQRLPRRHHRACLSDVGS
jgi:hypothetical protein